METIKGKFIKVEIDGITYEGFIQEVKEEAAAETAIPDNYSIDSTHLTVQEKETLGLQQQLL